MANFAHWHFVLYDGTTNRVSSIWYFLSIILKQGFNIKAFAEIYFE
jgi:hypothetical protein